MGIHDEGIKSRIMPIFHSLKVLLHLKEFTFLNHIIQDWFTRILSIQCEKLSEFIDSIHNTFEDSG